MPLFKATVILQLKYKAKLPTLIINPLVPKYHCTIFYTQTNMPIHDISSKSEIYMSVAKYIPREHLFTTTRIFKFKRI